MCYVYVYTKFNSKVLLISLNGLWTDYSEVLFLTHHLYKTFLESFFKIQVPRVPLWLNPREDLCNGDLGRMHIWLPEVIKEYGPTHLDV